MMYFPAFALGIFGLCFMLMGIAEESKLISSNGKFVLVLSVIYAIVIHAIEVLK